MQYLLMICDNERRWDGLTPDEAEATMARYRALTQELAQSGHYKGGSQLQRTTSATTVRVRDGKRQTTDGPFAETREQLGGYFLIEAQDLDEAIRIAERIPAAETGSIEIRPLVPMRQSPVAAPSAPSSTSAAVPA
jgi:hypothetical protein